MIAQAKNKKKEASLAAAKRDLAKAIKALDKPKKSLSGYQIFYHDLIKSQTISSLKEAQTYMKAIAGKWKGMSEAEKAKYNEKSKGLKANYEKDVAAWKEQLDEAKVKEVEKLKQKVFKLSGKEEEAKAAMKAKEAAKKAKMIEAKEARKAKKAAKKSEATTKKAKADKKPKKAKKKATKTKPTTTEA